MTDGCFARSSDADDLRFLPVTGLDVDALAAVLADLHRDLPDHLDEPPPVDDGQAACAQLGLSRPPPAASLDDSPDPRPMTVSAFGMQLYAASTVDGRDRERLERVCRYLLRPPFSLDAIDALPDARVSS